jgi:hypothetical protein
MTLLRRRLIGWALLAVLVTAGAVLVLRGCRAGPTKVERRVDSTLATIPAWVTDTLRVRDSIQAIADGERATLRQRSQRQARIIALAKRRADSLQALVDSTMDPGSASDSVAQLLPIVEGQQRAAVQFRLTIGALEYQHTLDTLQLRQADSTISLEREWRAQDMARIDRLTKDLSDLRNQTKHAGTWNVLGLHIPKCVLPTMAGTAGGGLVDRGSPLRGALIGAGAGLVGCLAG